MKCRKCGTEFDEGFFCPECGTRIEEEGSKENSDESKKGDIVQEEKSRENEKPIEAGKVGLDNTKMPQDVFCPKCGEQIESNLRFCPYCGTQFTSNAEYEMEGNLGRREFTPSATVNTAHVQKKTVKKKKGWMIAVPVAVLVIILVFIGISGFGSSDQIEESEKMVSKEEAFSDEDGSGDMLEEEIGMDELVHTETDVEEGLEENSVLQDTENDPETIESYTDVNFDYGEWEGSYTRNAGPYSGIYIWSIDETGILFAAGIGNSGYLAYRDIRDCNAEWVNDTVAVYDDGYGGTLEIALMTDGTLVVEEERTDTEDIMLLSGIYEKSDNLDLNDYGFVIKDSSHRIITENDLENLGPAECKIARNEIYARRGRLFADEQLQNYFESCAWYRGEIAAEDFSLDMLSDIERENAEFISAYEERMGYK